MTVLFADLEGFTAMTEQLPAHEVVERLNAHFTVMGGVLDAHEGRVDKYIGDAMLVVWDGPDPARSAQLACRAALEVQRAITRLHRVWLAEGKRPIKVRIGISSGRAILGEIGAPQHRERTVIGDAVNTAARLEALNKELHTDILVCESTRALLDGHAVVRDLGKLQLKGRREPIHGWALLGWEGAP